MERCTLSQATQRWLDVRERYPSSPFGRGREFIDWSWTEGKGSRQQRGCCCLHRERICAGHWHGRSRWRRSCRCRYRRRWLNRRMTTVMVARMSLSWCRLGRRSVRLRLSNARSRSDWAAGSLVVLRCDHLNLARCAFQRAFGLVPQSHRSFAAAHHVRWRWRWRRSAQDQPASWESSQNLTSSLVSHAGAQEQKNNSPYTREPIRRTWVQLRQLAAIAICSCLLDPTPPSRWPKTTASG